MSVPFSELFEAYEADHQHPRNRDLHLLGITLIGSGVLTIWFAPPLGLTLFVVGWAAQLLGHAIEGKPPSFAHDRRFMAVGAIWYVRELTALVRRSFLAPAA